jgi:hypothetical protein
MKEDKELARKMAAEDLDRFIEETWRKYPNDVFLGHWHGEAVPEVPGAGDGGGLLVNIHIGARGDLTRRAARLAAKSWRNYVKRYPEAHFVVSLTGYDQDPREIWEIDEAASYVRRWARLAGLNSLAQASQYLDEHGMAFLAACGVFGDHVKSQIQMPPKTIMQ